MKKMPKNLLMVVEKSKSAGFGHLSRCSRIAEHLAIVGINSELLLFVDDCQKAHSGGAYFCSKFHKVKVVHLASASNKRRDSEYMCWHILDTIDNPKDYLVLIDNYRMARKDIEQIASRSSIIEIRDDRNCSSVSQDNYCILIMDKQIQDDTMNGYESGLDLIPVLPPRLELTIPNEMKKCTFNILMYGGAAGYDFIYNTVGLLQDQKYGVEVQLYVAGEQERLSSLKGIRNVDREGIYDYIYYSDAVICAAGNMLLEGVFLNKMPIAFCTHSNQESVLNFLVESRRAYRVNTPIEVIALLAEKLEDTKLGTNNIKNGWADHVIRTEYARLVNIISDSMR